MHFSSWFCRFIFLLTKHCGAGWLFANKTDVFSLLFLTEFFPRYQFVYSFFLFTNCTPGFLLLFFFFVSYRETEIQSLVETCQRLKKLYLIPLCLTLSIIRYISRVKWSNPGKGVAPSSIPRRTSDWKRSFRVALDYGCYLYTSPLVLWVERSPMARLTGF